jgi:hypothetical protein
MHKSLHYAEVNVNEAWRSSEVTKICMMKGEEEEERKPWPTCGFISALRPG